MTTTTTIPTTPRTTTAITCTKCGKAGTVPFVPTPGRPVYCRDCYVPPAGYGLGGRPHPRPGARTAPRRPVPGARKRMLAQARKGHFIYDANEVLANLPGGVEEKNARAFLEGLFARGARGSVGDAQTFLDEKLDEGVLLTPEQHEKIGRLLERYSFWR